MHRMHDHVWLWRHPPYNKKTDAPHAEGIWRNVINFGDGIVSPNSQPSIAERLLLRRQSLTHCKTGSTVFTMCKLCRLNRIDCRDLQSASEEKHTTWCWDIPCLTDECKPVTENCVDVMMRKSTSRQSRPEGTWVQVSWLRLCRVGLQRETCTTIQELKNVYPTHH